MLQYFPHAATVRNCSMRSAPQITPKPYNEATCLEYGLLKGTWPPVVYSDLNILSFPAPYEMLNRKFRTSIKRIGKPYMTYKTVSAAIANQIPEKNQRIPIEKISEKYKILTKKIQEFTTAFHEGVERFVNSYLLFVEK